MDEVTTKRCTKCSETKPVSEFGKQKVRKDGLNPWCRACKKAEAAARYLVKRDDILAANAAWAKANPEKRRGICRRFAEANPDRVKGYHAKYAKQNPEKRRAWSMADYWRNREARLAAARAWQKLNRGWNREYRRGYRDRNREAYRARHRNRKALVRQAAGMHTAADVRRIYADQRGRCAYCRSSLRGGYHVDHVRPLSRGGSNAPSNLQLTCAACNLSKKDKDPLVFARSRGRLL